MNTSENVKNFLKLVSDEKSNWLEKANWRKENRDWLQNSAKIAILVLSELNKTGMSKKILADKMGVSVKYINKIVKGSENLTLKTISQLEKSLDIKLIEIQINNNNIMNDIEKQEARELALSKLTIEEQELLGLIKKPKKPRVRKNYKLKINYMIGDANGHTDEEAEISVNNPFLKPVTEALDKLGEIKGHWGIMLDEEHYAGNKEIGNINDFEYELLCLVTYYYDNNNTDEFFEKYGFENTEENLDFLGEFDGLFRFDTEYSFLVYEGYKLK